MEPICRRHRIATSLLSRWPIQFGLTAEKESQPVTVAFAYGAPNDVPALGALRGLVRPPNEMTANELR